MSCTTWRSTPRVTALWRSRSICGDEQQVDTNNPPPTPPIPPVITPPVDPEVLPMFAILAENLDYLMAEDGITYIIAEGDSASLIPPVDLGLLSEDGDFLLAEDQQTFIVAES